MSDDAKRVKKLIGLDILGLGLMILYLKVLLIFVAETNSEVITNQLALKQIDISGYPKGTCFVRIESDIIVKTEKIIFD
jgi:hypothetical protein